MMFCLNDCFNGAVLRVSNDFILQQTANQTQTDSLSPSPNPVSPVPLNNQTSTPRYGTVIPNRIFVGGIDFKVSICGCNAVGKEWCFVFL